MQRVAVYGGSFNPLHIGHLAVMRHLTMFYERILLVVSPKNPLKDIDASSARGRLEAASEALRRHPELWGKVEVSDIEFKLPTPNYTIRTMDALSNDDTELTLVMGGDQMADIRRWKDYSRLLREYGIAVFPRHGFNLPELKQELLAEDDTYKILLLDAPEVIVSSTFIREGLEEGDDMSEWLM